MTDWRTRLNAALGIPSTKAVTGPGVAAYYTDTPLSSLQQDPLQKAAVFLRAYGNDWFHKAGSKISLDIAQLKVSVSPEGSDGDNEEKRVEPDLFTPWERLDPIGQFLRLMERPNPYQTGRALFQKTEIRLDFAGWTHWYLEDAGPQDSGQLPTAIYGISPTRLTPSFDKQGVLIGWVLDADSRGGGTPFPAYQIVTFYRERADDHWGGMGVVEAVWQQAPLSDAMARHTGDVLSTGGRLAGMLWPKNRALDQAEFEDAQRAWRNTTSNGDAGRRLLLFPEPMEYAVGASTPAEIGIPELAMLNRDDILTAFPISPYQLGVPMPGGLNSAETRREDRRDYWEGTIHPRVELLEETIQTKILSLYESVVGSTFDFDIMEPNLDDAASLLAKADALDKLVTQGFDEKETIKALQLDHIKWTKPEPVPLAVPVPAAPVEVPPAQGQEAPPAKSQGDLVAMLHAVKARPVKAKAEDRRDKVVEPASKSAQARLDRFFTEQSRRVTDAMRKSLPDTTTQRMKAQPTWWDAEFEDDELRAVMRAIYSEVGIGGLQTVADTLGRFIFKGATQSIIADLLEFGGERIADINARTLQAITVELAEGTRRAYSIPQLIEGVPEEGYKGVLQAGLDNGVEVWSDLRAETIARTETMLSYNRATVTGYGEFGVKYLLAYDGDQDEECANRNGQEFTIEEAAGIDDHPNGTLVWSPVVDKAVRSEPPQRPDVVALKALEILARPQPDIHVHAPDITLPDIDFDPMLEAIAGLREEVKAVKTPIVHVPAPVVNVPAPVVNVKAADITDVRVLSMPDREHKIKKDRSGKPTGSTETDI